MLRVIILAAGQGKRMQSDLPKVLLPYRGMPMIKYVLAAVKAAASASRPLIVVGYKAELVKQTLGPAYDYVIQTEQLGTGHAVACAKNFLKDKAADILILYGDQPKLGSESIKKIIAAHKQGGKVLTMATVRVKDFADWRASFYDFGRIIRDNNKIKAIIELKDCTADQKQITEVNPSFFCFQAGWLWKNISKLSNNNAQGEYYLTDLVKMAIVQGREVAEVEIAAGEALGINNKEQLNILEKSADLLTG